MNRDRERGASRLKILIWVLIIGCIIYAAAKIVPVYLANFELLDKMRDEALYAQANRRTAQQVHDAIYREAQDLGMSIGTEEINVGMGPQGTHITVVYTATVDLIVYKFPLHFSDEAGHE